LAAIPRPAARAAPQRGLVDRLDRTFRHWSLAPAVLLLFALTMFPVVNLLRMAVSSVHAGIVFEPAFIVGPEVRAGRLVPLLQDFVAPPMPVFAVYPSRKHLSAKVRLFVDFVVARFSQAQDWSAV
jgi:DNA-binding transcriptional LysR family regulator